MFPHGQNAKGAERKELDMEELEKLCGLQCTIKDIAGWFGVTSQTVDNRIADTERRYSYDLKDLKGHIIEKRTDVTFREAMELGYAKGRVSLRRHQMKAAEEGQPTMLVWLGKNVLGQKDNLELSGPAGGPIETNVTLDPHERLLGKLRGLAPSGDAGEVNSKPAGN